MLAGFIGALSILSTCLAASPVPRASVSAVVGGHGEVYGPRGLDAPTRDASPAKSHDGQARMSITLPHGETSLDEQEASRSTAGGDIGMSDEERARRRAEVDALAKLVADASHALVHLERSLKQTSKQQQVTAYKYLVADSVAKKMTSLLLEREELAKASEAHLSEWDEQRRRLDADKARLQYVQSYTADRLAKQGQRLNELQRLQSKLRARAETAQGKLSAADYETAAATSGGHAGESSAAVQEMLKNNTAEIDDLRRDVSNMRDIQKRGLELAVNASLDYDRVDAQIKSGTVIAKSKLQRMLSTRPKVKKAMYMMASASQAWAKANQTLVSLQGLIFNQTRHLHELVEQRNRVESLNFLS